MSNIQLETGHETHCSPPAHMELAVLWSNWARNHADANHLSEALEGFRCAQLLSPGDDAMRSNLSAATDILASYRQPLSQQISAEDLKSIRATAISHFREGKLASAANIFRELLLVRDEPVWWCDLGTVHVAMENWVEGELAYRKAIALDNSNQTAATNLVTLLTRLNRKDAEEWISQIPPDALLRARFSIQQELMSVEQELILRLTEIPQHDPQLSPTAPAWNRCDSSYFVQRCCALLAAVATAARPRILAKLKPMAEKDYRLKLVFAQLLMDSGQHDEALPLAREVFDQYSSDLHAGRLLDACLQHCPADDGSTEEYLKDRFCQQLIFRLTEIPQDDPQLSPEMITAISRNRGKAWAYCDSSYYVKRCCELLAAVPMAIRPVILEKLKPMSEKDYRLKLLFAQLLIDSGQYEEALPLVQAVSDQYTSDLCADRLLDYCIQHRHGNATATEEYLKTRFCPVPWQQVDVHPQGVFMCCPAWLPVPIGKLGEGTPEEMWNSPVAQEVRASILDGSFRYCNRNACVKIAGRTLTEEKSIDKGRVTGDAISPVSDTDQPMCIGFSYDRTCNLACPSCRKDFFTASAAEVQEMNALIEPMLVLCRNANTLDLDGAGDVFASRYGRLLLKRLTRAEFPDLKFRFVTNGQLLNRRAYEEFDLQGRIEWINVSMDAAKPETYEVVRRGGKLEPLLNNLHFLDDLRIHEGAQFGLTILFVVSSFNYREMPAFVEIGRSIQADCVGFVRIRNVGTFSREQFQSMNIADSAHPEHKEFLGVLQHKNLYDPIVELGSVKGFQIDGHNEDAT